METPKSRNGKKERLQILLAQIEKWKGKGLSGELLLDKLTPDQFDFLVDMDVDTDTFVLTAEQRANIAEVKRSPRPVGLRYNKKYPKDKQELFGNLKAFLMEQGAEVLPKEKENYRDIDFTFQGVKYRIVLSLPRS